MSMFLIIEAKDCVWFGADSALSHKVDGKSLRDPNIIVEKVFSHAGGVFACGGSWWDACGIRQYIESLPSINEESLTDIAIALKRIAAYSRSKGYTEDGVATVIMCCLVETGRVYGMSIINDFAIESPTDPKLSGFRPIACIGVTDAESDRGCELADTYYPQSTSIQEVYGKVYSELSCNGMGGHVDLYCLNIKEKSIQRYFVPLVEENIEYINASAQMQGGSINWGMVNSDPATKTAETMAKNALKEAANASDDAAEATKIAKQIADGAYAKGTFINGTEIFSPKIRANEFTVLPDNKSDQSGGYLMYNYFDGKLMPIFKISYWAGMSPVVNFASPCGAYANWDFGMTRFNGNLDFSDAKVTGLEATFA